MNFTFGKRVYNVTPVPNPTQYTKLCKYMVKHKNRNQSNTPQISKFAVFFSKNSQHGGTFQPPDPRASGTQPPRPWRSLPGYCTQGHIYHQEKSLFHQEKQLFHWEIHSKQIRHILRFWVFETNCDLFFTIYLPNLVYWVGFVTGMTF